MQWTLLASGGLALLAAAAYVALAVVFLRREGRPEFRAPRRLFAYWWGSVGANLALTGVATIAAGLGSRDLALFATQAYLERLILATGLFALLAYVGFLNTGDRRTWLPAALFYLAYYLLVLFNLASGRPVAVELHDWARPTLVTSAPTPRGLSLLSLAMLLVPPVVASMAYFRFFFRTRDPRQRLRVAVISWGIVAWFLLSITAYFASDSLPLQVANRTISLAIAFSILYVARR